MQREVHHGDGIAWLREADLGPETAIVTSLPDSVEVPALGFEGWRTWFVETVTLCLERVHPGSVALFFQTDVKRDGRWVDKSLLCHQGASAAGAHLLWHKIVCRAPAGTITFGRPAYAHLLAYSRELRVATERSTADVLPRLGEMTWPRAMGVEACVAACRFVLEQTPARRVVDPFCGVGTVLAVANALGLSALGVESARKRAERARVLAIDCR